ncbi:hypothetical protein KKG71_02610 [Patescibacteria group bacterium]|nr:hypothetical protein [Patescibacteria group bacterium]
MKILNILGVGVLSTGVLMIAGFGLYKFFEDSEIPLVIKGGFTIIILGVIIILVSLIRERLKEMKSSN